MNLIIKRVHLWNFKGIRERVVDFQDKLTKITGRNASGKTTVASAIFWVFCNEDYDLKSNPPVHPIGTTEATPTVEIIMEINGKPLRICKTQTMKVTEVGEVRKVSTSNTYTCNDIPMAERDIQKKLAEYGADITKFEVLAHPDSFLLGKKDDIRKMLFSMTDGYTDLDVANELGSVVSETAKLLENYKLDEVKAMQNATLKKISEVYGRKGEIINARIDELEGQKTDVDIAEAELWKNSLTESLNKIAEQRKSNNDIQKSIEILQQRNMDLQFEISGIKNNSSKAKQEMLAKMQAEVVEIRSNLDTIAKTYHNLQADRDTTNKRLEYAERELGVAKEILGRAESMEFDTHSEICPTCKQKLPDSDIAILRSNFEKDKADKIAKAKADIEESEHLVNSYRDNIKELDNKISSCKSNGKTIQENYQDAVNKFNSYKAIPDGEPTEELKAKEKELSEIGGKIEDLKKGFVAGLDMQEVELREQLSQVDKKFAVYENNNRIDERIAELRDKQIGYEQSRADAEKILFQIEIITKKKYEMLTEAINSHFSIVKWSFYKTQKNGEIAETCEAFIDGKEMTTACNSALQIMAKVDICNSLQNYYDQHYPIVIDGAEALDSSSQNKLDTKTQVVLLEVTD